ncbi:type II toxin-antitoxin system RelE/ParE family toxin [Sedimenticola hydrogenitrophicus]|uniref:type II toxin-antitoxin system RelE/ParE family toxin n=1 Tax=Sedimenticola hydrogenitrophicus TaxID=2967975 RepID=UPI0021A974EC
MDWSLRLSEQADRDIASILAWTDEQFGSAQADTYTETIHLALAALLAGPDLPGSKIRDDISSGIRLLHIARHGRKGRHFLVYRSHEPLVIDVLRVLHDSMDPPKHIGR